MKHLVKKLEELEFEVATAFSSMLRLKPKFVFLSEDDIDNCEFDEEFDYINNITGNCIGIHIISVDEFGIHCCDADDSSKRRTIKFSDLASISYQIRLCQLMEESK
jgi:hypothetical protein